MSYTPSDRKQYWLNVLFRERVFLPGTEGVIVPSGITAERPSVPLDGVRMSRQLMYYNSSKAVKELGLPQSSLDEALSVAVEWFNQKIST